MVKKPANESAAEREANRQGGNSIKPTVKPGDPRAMQQLLGTFSNDGEGNLTREFDTKQEDGHFSPLSSYRQLLVVAGANIAPLSELEKDVPVDLGQGITMNAHPVSKLKTHCTLTVPAEPFMQMAAAYGYDATAKLLPQNHDRWTQIQAETSTRGNILPRP